jgi:hypothetical protein
VSWVGDAQAALEAQLNGRPHVSSLQLGAGTATFQFAGPDDDAAALLAKLVAAGIRVKAFGEVKQTVEDLYMKLSRHEVM